MTFYSKRPESVNSILDIATRHEEAFDKQSENRENNKKILANSKLSPTPHVQWSQPVVQQPIQNQYRQNFSQNYQPSQQATSNSESKHCNLTRATDHIVKNSPKKRKL